MVRKENIVKRTLSLKNNELFTNVVSDEALSLGITESSVIEDTVLEKFVNFDNADFLFWTKTLLFEKDGLKRTIQSICNHYSALPQDVNDNVAPLLLLMYDIEMKNMINIKGNEKILHHFKEQLKSFIEFLSSRKNDDKNNYAPMLVFDPNGKEVKITSDVIDNLKDIYEYIDIDPNMINGKTHIAVLIRNIYDFWNLGNSSPTLKNWTRIWRLLGDICELANWPDLPEYRNRLLKIMKVIQYGNNDSLPFDENEPLLNKIIYLNCKTIRTVENVVIIKSNEKLELNEFKNVKRIIHGFNQKTITDKLILIVYNDENLEELLDIARQKVPKDEFPVNFDLTFGEILKDKKYLDNRVIWDTV